MGGLKVGLCTALSVKTCLGFPEDRFCLVECLSIVCLDKAEVVAKYLRHFRHWWFFCKFECTSV